MFCGKCGRKIDGKMIFCPRCGHKTDVRCQINHIEKDKNNNTISITSNKEDIVFYDKLIKSLKIEDVNIENKDIDIEEDINKKDIIDNVNTNKTTNKKRSTMNKKKFVSIIEIISLIIICLFIFCIIMSEKNTKYVDVIEDFCDALEEQDSDDMLSCILEEVTESGTTYYPQYVKSLLNSIVDEIGNDYNVDYKIKKKTICSKDKPNELNSILSEYANNFDLNINDLDDIAYIECDLIIKYDDKRNIQNINFDLIKINGIWFIVDL